MRVICADLYPQPSDRWLWITQSDTRDDQCVAFIDRVRDLWFQDELDGFYKSNLKLLFG